MKLLIILLALILSIPSYKHLDLERELLWPTVFLLFESYLDTQFEEMFYLSSFFGLFVHFQLLFLQEGEEVIVTLLYFWACGQSGGVKH